MRREERNANQPADKGVCRGGRQSQEPCRISPENSSEHCGQKHWQSDDTAVDNSLADRVGNGGVQKAADEIQSPSHDNGFSGRHGPCRNRCGDGIGGIVEAVDEVIHQGGPDDKDQKKLIRHSQPPAVSECRSVRYRRRWNALIPHKPA